MTDPLQSGLSVDEGAVLARFVAIQTDVGELALRVVNRPEGAVAHPRRGGSCTTVVARNPRCGAPHQAVIKTTPFGPT